MNTKKSIKKILHITFNMGIGGTEQVISQIIKNSDAERFQHEILCIDGIIGVLGRELQGKGINIETVKRRPGFDLILVRFIKNYINNRKVNVLHCHQYTPYFYGVLGALRSQVKIIFTEHGRFYPDRKHFKRMFINPLLVLKTAHITAISKSTADAMAKYEHIQRDKIQVIYNGIRDLKKQKVDKDGLIKELGLTDDYLYIGTISRLEPIKNQSMMINAFYQIKQKIPNIKLIIIGDGAMMADLKKLAETLDIAGDVIFTGFINKPQKYLNLFEVFLLSSFSEGASMTILEAMSLGKPCVVTNVGGNPEIVVNNKTGFIRPSYDAEKFASAIIYLLEDEKLRNKFGASARNRFLSNFSVNQMVEKYESLYLKNNF